MNDEDQAVREFQRKPTVVHRGPASIEDLLQHVDPAPDEETGSSRPSTRIDAMPGRCGHTNEPDRRRYRRGLLHLQLALICPAPCGRLARFGIDSLLRVHRGDAHGRACGALGCSAARPD